MTVRVEGRTHPLLAPTVVHTHTGSLTRGGAPRGACSTASGAGALDAATNHRWSGPFVSSFGDYEIKTVLGETESSKSYYWGIWIDDRYATTGACGIKLHHGDRLLFAVDSVSHHEHPMALSAPRKARVAHPFAVKVVWFGDAGVSTPLAGARVTGGGVTVVTDGHGIARFFPSRVGTLVFHGNRAGYIRAAPVGVRVSA